jgi:cytochrome c-type biogenesis protein CcmF
MHSVVIPFVIAVAILLFDVYKARRDEKSNLGFFGYALIFIGFVLYVLAFLTDDFTLKEVFTHSSKSLDPIFKFSASWSGSGGFIVWWLFVFTLLTFIRRIRSKDLRVVFYYDLTIIALFFIALLNGAFDSLDFVPKNGVGLNPLLKTFWMLLHPPASFIGYALGLFIAIDVFLNKEDRFAIGLTWLFITLANVLGGVWSYFTLGWGGYWAWDPVETGLLLPWLTLTAYFHSTQLRKGLIALTGFSVAFAGFVTRGGISPLHGFAVNPSGLVIILLGIPFLIKALKELKTAELKLTPMNVATYSLLGSYFVCFAGLIYQLLFAIGGSRVDVNVDYYNFANMPFLVAFLSVLPICKAENYKNYLKILAVVYAISAVLTVLTFLGYINWCDSAPIHVNSAISFVLPIALFSFVSVLKLQKLELKLIHFSIPLLVIATSISWPYAYYADYKSVVVDKNES